MHRRKPALIPAPLLALVLAGVLAPALLAQDTPPPVPASATAGQPAGAPAADGAAAPDTAPAGAADGDDDGGWNFDDEDEETAAREQTLGEIIKPQIPDIAAFTGLMILCMVSFARRSPTLKIATLVYTLVFLGFMRSQLYSVVNIFGLMTANLPIPSHAVFTYMFWIAALGTTVIWGRLYCGRLCAFGALTQLMDTVVPNRWQVKIPAKVEQNAFYFKYALLAFVIVYYLATEDILISRYVEPFWMFGALANFTAFTSVPGAWFLWGLLGALLLATVVIRNLYCRFICPVGTFLGIISSLTTIFRIKRWSECKTCTICERTCEWGAIQGPRIVRSECVRCDDCEIVYDDKKKCVHWIVIERKDVLVARAAARAAAAQARMSGPREQPS
jgi:NAD-dependent dihydropyrimidine dehydrogenase PreA subunit